MVANPMQKKARNSFLLGVVITLVICLSIFVLIYFLVINKEKKEEEQLGQKVTAYVLSQNVQSGDIVTSNLLVEKEVYETMIPSNYITKTQFLNMQLQDKYGNLLYTNSKGELYMIKDNKKYKTTTSGKDDEVEIIVEEDERGFFKTTISGGKEYIEEDVITYSSSKGENYIIETKVLIEEDEQGFFKTKIDGEKEYIQNQPMSTNSKGENYIIEKNNIQYIPTEGGPDKVLIQQDTEGYYRIKANGGIERIELLDVPFVAKIDLAANTIITSDLFSKGENVSEDLRYVEYNMLVLPTTIMVGDYIDIRLTLPNGQDLIVVSKKEVKSMLGDTIGLRLTEGEILMMESAIVEAYIMTASKLYAIQYVEPGNQEAATKTYTPTTAVQELIKGNPNIVNDAKTELVGKFNGTLRQWTDVDKNAYAADSQENLEEGLQKEIENAKAAREAYLSGLTSY